MPETVQQYADHVARLVAAAPPLTERQRDELARLFRPSSPPNALRRRREALAPRPGDRPPSPEVEAERQHVEAQARRFDGAR